MESDKVSGGQAFWMVKEIVSKIESKLRYPSQIKVIVIQMSQG